MERLSGAQELVRLLASGVTLLVGTAGLRAQNGDGSTVAPVTDSGSLKAGAPEDAGFFHRLSEAYPHDWLGKSPGSPESPRRAIPRANSPITPRNGQS